MTERIYLYGKNPLEEAILSWKRTGSMPIAKLNLTKYAEENSHIMSLIQSAKLDYTTVTQQEIESMVGKNTVHQGICAELHESVLYTELSQVLGEVASNEKNSLIVLLDKLKDPHNVGAIIRSAVAFGASAVLIPEHDQVALTGTVIKASSGMSFAIPIVKIGNVNTVIETLKKNKFWIYGLTGDGETKLNDTVFDANTVLVIGGEGEGLHAKTIEHCDFTLAIETNPLCESLNASNATTVVLYEWAKQNSVHGNNI